MREEFRCIIEMFYSVNLNQVLVAVFYRKLFINFFFFLLVFIFHSPASVQITAVNWNLLLVSLIITTYP